MNARLLDQDPLPRVAGVQPGIAPIGRSVSRLAGAPAHAPLAATPDPLEAARRDAFSQAHADGLRRGREEGLRQGYADGLKKGLADAQTRIDASLEQALASALRPVQAKEKQLAELIARLDAATGDILAGAEDELVALCYETLCRVLAATALTPQGVQAQVAWLLAALPRGATGVLHLHPQDAKLLDDIAAQDRVMVALSRRGFSWVPDPDVALGGCVLKHAGGTLDARLDTILQRCKTALLEARAQATELEAEVHAVVHANDANADADVEMPRPLPSAERHP